MGDHVEVPLDELLVVDINRENEKNLLSITDAHTE